MGAEARQRDASRENRLHVCATMVHHTLLARHDYTTHYIIVGVRGLGRAAQRERR